ncbi:MAG TPA: hypothetical protein P5340_06580 [Defluviicoccus sp.]|nr:hypothetical protein [Defluviicoccus sp.]
MRKEFTVEFDVHERRGRAGSRQMHPGEAPAQPDLPPGRVPRISRLMALAIRCQELVRRGEAVDYADVARLAHVTRARMSQITNLLNLAPDIQEQLLHLPLVTSGHDPIGERDMRPIAVIPDWREQRRLFATLQASSQALSQPVTSTDHL